MNKSIVVIDHSQKQVLTSSSHFSITKKAIDKCEEETGRDLSEYSIISPDALPVTPININGFYYKTIGIYFVD